MRLVSDEYSDHHRTRLGGAPRYGERECPLCGHFAAILLNGLRDYGIEPQVWGGEGAICPPDEHEWGGGLRRTGGAGKQGETSQRNGRGNVEAQETARAAGAFCRHCNAWRGSLGLEPTLELYVDHMVEVCREIRRVLRRDGTFWLNIGDNYASSPNGRSAADTKALGRDDRTFRDRPISTVVSGLKPKDLMMMPARIVLALQADGWWVRSEIVWAKDAPMPESCTDRPTSAHEKVFLLTKSARYFYDAEAVKEEVTGNTHSRGTKLDPPMEHAEIGHIGWTRATKDPVSSRNLRNVWRLPPAPFPEAHFATFPPELPRRCIKAGTRPGDTVLDPFLGSGTTAMVADQLGRDCIGIELSPKYAAMAERRVREDNSLFAEIAAE